jgi:hypothetical protein
MCSSLWRWSSGTETCRGYVKHLNTNCSILCFNKQCIRWKKKFVHIGKCSKLSSTYRDKCPSDTEGTVCRADQKATTRHKMKFRKSETRLSVTVQHHLCFLHVTYKRVNKIVYSSLSLHGVHGTPKGPWLDFRKSMNLNGKEKYNFIFTNLEMKFGFSCNSESRKQSYLWPLDSKNIR